MTGPGPDAGASALRIALSVPAGARPGPGRLPLQLDFHNAGATPLRLLRRFEPLPVFFAFDLVDAQGRALDLPGAGKADFPEGSLQYAELPPGASLAVTLDLAPSLARPEQLRPGRYQARVEYHNQYGQGCWRGRAGSAAITLEVPA